jgi:hypothetical protein
MRLLNWLLVLSMMLAFAACDLEFGEKSPEDSQVNFATHIAPIIHRNCTPCHRPGAAGPFPLITYQQVRKKAKTICKVTKSRYMPPWPADPEYVSFIGEKRLSNEEIQLLARWVSQGCAPGDTSDLRLPEFPEGSMLGRPDWVIHFREPVPLPGDNTDRFMMVKVPFELPFDTFLRAVEYVPGNRKLVHHTNGHIVHYTRAHKKQPMTGPFYAHRDSFQNMDAAFRYINLLNDDGSYPPLTLSAFNYLPGMNPLSFPDGIGGFKIGRSGAFLLNDQHYGPSLRDTSDYSTLNLFFMEKPPVRPLMETQLGSLGISEIVPRFNIPAGTVRTFHTRAMIRSDISIISVNPHMHLLGTTFKAFAVPPTGDTIPLVYIPRWDFRWQYTYVFRKPQHIPAGSVVWAFGTFDNRASNPRNPFSPPHDFNESNSSMKTTDEMFQLIFQYLPYQDGDEHIDLEYSPLSRSADEVKN